MLGVCGGYQLLGHSYTLGDEEIAGVGLLDVRTVREQGPRLIGNVAIEVDARAAAPRVLAGFENHGGRTHLGPGAPLGRVLRGPRQRRAHGFEGARRGNVIGTYLHGPLLPKNVWFADWLIARALGLDARELAPLDDELEARGPRAARGAPPGVWSQRPREPKPPLAAARSSASVADLDRLGERDRPTTSCAMRSPGATSEGLAAVGVQQQHLQLAAVAGVDQARAR